MIDGTNPLGDLLINPYTPSTSGKKDLGKEDFLQLLLVQLQNQDPLSPLEPHEFASQLATFSSLEQLSALNETMTGQTMSLDMVSQMTKASISASLIGREIVAVGDQVVVPAQGNATIRVEIGSTGGATRLRLLDESGHEVAVRDLGHQPGGRRTIELPADLPPGTYRYELEVKDAAGAVVPVTTFTSGVVEGIYFDEGQIILRVGSLRILMDDVVEIEPPPPEDA
jgi:flagellar basal-body rod modification protein FlgD